MYTPPEDETDVPSNVDNRLNQAPAKDEEDAIGKASIDTNEALAKRPGDELTPPAPSPKEDATNDAANDDAAVCTAVPSCEHALLAAHRRFSCHIRGV